MVTAICIGHSASQLQVMVDDQFVQSSQSTKLSFDRMPSFAFDELFP